MSKPHISTRKYIKWGKEKPASENTDTLVLTSASNYFVDIRIFLPDSSARDSSLPSSSTPLPLSRLEWAFAGTSASTPAVYSSSDSEVVKLAHTIWTHWVDSKTTDDVRDEGDMKALLSDGETLEFGTMVNPESGLEEKYEECWVDLEIGNVHGERGCRSWVLKVEDEEVGVRGMAVRIGVYIQVVLRRRKEVSIGRWKWDARQGWETAVVIGSVEIPPAAFSGENLELGKIWTGSGGLEWTCVESFDWS